MTKPRNLPVRAYDRLLRCQADLSSDLEQVFFRQSDLWISARNVLDFGSGNSYYTRLLSNRFPTKTFTCVDKDPALVTIAHEIWDHTRIKTILGSYTSLCPKQPYDFVYARLVLSYLDRSEHLEFIKWLHKNCASQSAVLIIDADDSAFFCSPRLPMLEAGIQRFNDELVRNGGNRSLKCILDADFASAGFRKKITIPLVVHSEIAGRKLLMSMFIASLAEVDYGLPIPQPLIQEITSWTTDSNSYLQYGLFGTLYERET